jgi:8-oxo-dGTP diphosphatase
MPHETPSPTLTQELRVAAYAVCIRDAKILLTRWVRTNGKQWTLPGGGILHGEDPYDAAIREVAEETGYAVAVQRLLGLDTIHRRVPRDTGTELDFHGLRIIYSANVVSGALRHEVGGTTDRAAWIHLDHVGGLDRVGLVDIGMELDRTHPLLGRLENGRLDDPTKRA